MRFPEDQNHRLSSILNETTDHQSFSEMVSTSICRSVSWVESTPSAEVPFFPEDSFECLHFMRLFWNHTFTWASVNPRVAANCRLSGFVMYFCNWNLLSNPFLCKLLNTALDHDRFLLLLLLGFAIVVDCGAVGDGGNGILIAKTNFIIYSFVVQILILKDG